MLRATIRVEGPVARATVPAIAPEAERQLPRTEVSVRYDGDDALIDIEASDSSSMRAALNSYMECIRIIEEIDRLAKVRT